MSIDCPQGIQAQCSVKLGVLASQVNGLSDCINRMNATLQRVNTDITGNGKVGLHEKTRTLERRQKYCFGGLIIVGLVAVLIPILEWVFMYDHLKDLIQ